MWNPFTRSVPTPAPVVHTLTPTIKLEDLSSAVTNPALPQAVQLLVPRTVLLKKLKWIVYRGKVGIVWELDSSGYATIHLTDPQGQTVDVERVNATELRLAKYAEIPAPRRVGLSQVYAATLGYF